MKITIPQRPYRNTTRPIWRYEEEELNDTVSISLFTPEPQAHSTPTPQTSQNPSPARQNPRQALFIKLTKPLKDLIITSTDGVLPVTRTQIASKASMLYNVHLAY